MDVKGWNLGRKLGTLFFLKTAILDLKFSCTFDTICQVI
jgi:hypothetical protein